MYHKINPEADCTVQDILRLLYEAGAQADTQWLEDHPELAHLFDKEGAQEPRTLMAGFARLFSAFSGNQGRNV